MKKYLYLFLICVLIASCKSASNSKITTSKVNKKELSSLANQIIKTATENLGISYKAAGTTSDGFDCSGLVFASFKKYEILLPRSSFDMSKKGVKIDKNDVQKGDLIFFKTNGKSIINHVGLVVEVNDDEIKFIHASTQKGVIISSTKESYYGKSIAQINRILLPE